ncbi:MAG: RNA polymerase sigma factor [Anaerolineales bacterium]|nr:RNA polymerase sigma factor [Anaerolineales bacterium]
MDSVSDRELIISLQGGDLEALGVLYDRHRHLVYRTALAITGDTEAAADLLQDVFLRLHRFVDRVDVNRPLEPWLYRMVANLSYTWVKRRRRWFRPLEDIAEWFAGSRKEMPLHQVEENESSSRIRQAVADLPLVQRVVVVLYYVNDLPLLEISEILDIPVGTVKSRLHYGRQMLKNSLDESHTAFPELQYEFT